MTHTFLVITLPRDENTKCTAVMHFNKFAMLLMDLNSCIDLNVIAKYRVMFKVIYYILHLIELTMAEAMSIPIISLYTRDSGCWLLCIKSSNVPPGMNSTIGNVLANYTLIVYECWNAPDINRVQYSTYDDVIKPWTNTCHAKNKIIIHINLKTFNSIIIIILGLVVLVARIKEECT